MDTKVMAKFSMSLDKLCRSVKNTMEELEPHIDDPVIEDYVNNLKDVANELEGTVYAVEAALDWNTSHESDY